MDKERYDAEKAKLESKLGFFTHLGIYLVVNGFIIFSEFIYDDFHTSLLPLFAWGIGVISHFLRVFVFNREYIERVVKKKID